MSEFSKLFWGAALVAVGFGIATLFGPPEPEPSPYRPAITPRVAGPLSLDGPQRVPTYGLPLRASNQQTAAPAGTADPWNQSSAAGPPTWVKPTSEIAPTAWFPQRQTESVALALATAELPAEQKAPSAAPFAARETESSTARALPRTDAPAAPVASPWDAAAVSTTQPVFATVESSVESSARPQQWSAPPAEEPFRTHIVVDGDSLARLADRYLDSPERGWEIFQLNQDQLRSPDLLPIGAVLKVPPRQPQTDQLVAEPRDVLTPQVTRGVSYTARAEQPDLVPVAPVTTSPLAQPKARLLQPVPLE